MADYLELKQDELNLQDITDLVGSADCGAISVFIGKFLLNKNYFLLIEHFIFLIKVQQETKWAIKMWSNSNMRRMIRWRSRK